MKLRLLIPDAPFIPDAELPLESGGYVKNRDIEKLAAEGLQQIRCENERADVETKQRYSAQVTNFTKDGGMQTERVHRYNTATANHCKKIEGLEGLGIFTGSDLAEYKAPEGQRRHTVLDLITQEIYLDVIGAHPDDDDLESE